MQPKEHGKTHPHDKPISLSHMSLEDALRKAMNTPKPKGDKAKKKNAGKSGSGS